MLVIPALIFEGTLLGALCYALLRVRRIRAEDLQFHARIGAVPVRRISESPATGVIRIAGRASGLGGSAIAAPFSGTRALWAQASLRTGAGRVVRAWTETVETIVVDDGSGRVLHLCPTGATFRMRAETIHEKDSVTRVADYLKRQGWRVPRKHNYNFPYEAVLVPGETINVIGTVAALGGNSTDGGIIRISATDGELVVFDSDAEMGRPAERSQQIGCATVGILASILAIIITLLLAR